MNSGGASSASDAARVIGVFGAGVDVEVALQPLHTPTIGRYRVGAARTRRQVSGCTACPLCDSALAPVPPVYPPRPPLFIVLGEAPGPDEDRRGQPFVGKSGELMRDLLGRCDVDVDAEVAWGNTVSCYPYYDRRGGELRQDSHAHSKPRPPSASEQGACRRNCLSTVQSAATRYVLLVGGTALAAWRDDFAITHLRGTVGVWRDTYAVMPVYHPAYVLRNRALIGILARDIARFVGIARSNSILDHLEVKCVVCNGDLSHYDRDGLAWCGECWTRRGEKAWRKVRGDWGEKADRGIHQQFIGRKSKVTKTQKEGML